MAAAQKPRGREPAKVFHTFPALLPMRALCCAHVSVTRRLGAVCELQ